MDYQELKKNLKNAEFEFDVRDESRCERTLGNIRFELILHPNRGNFGVMMFHGEKYVLGQLILYDEANEELNEINEFYRDYRQGENSDSFDERESTEDERNAL